MAGAGKRFADAGYKKPKPLIDVFGEPMISAVVKNLWHEDARFIFVLNKEQREHPEIIDTIKALGIDYKLYHTPHLTEGPACTALLAANSITNDNLMIINCDQVIRDYDYHKLLEFVRTEDADGLMGAFISSSKKNSYMKLDPNGEVIDVKEKIVISNVATNGLHFWKNGKDFIASALQMIAAGEKYNDEFYVAPTYNYLIKQGKKILPYFYNLHWPIGTPEDLDLYHRKYYI